MIVPDRHSEAPDTEVLLRRVLDLVNSAPKMPLSSTVRMEKDEVVEMLEEAIARLPEEMRQARWLLKERQEYLAKVQREGDEILSAARERAERIVQRHVFRGERRGIGEHTLQRLAHWHQAQRFSSARQAPDLPPCFSSRRMPSMCMPFSIALTIS